tara:strand:+ start:1008 stop:1238 length:231 start_codon:yes stop_codon:yes gene_type:complete
MIRDRQDLEQRPIEIDLQGPEGNAFLLIGKASKLSKQLGHSKEEIEDIKNDMQSGDYEHLIDVFEKHYGDFVILYR